MKIKVPVRTNARRTPGFSSSVRTSLFVLQKSLESDECDVTMRLLKGDVPTFVSISNCWTVNSVKICCYQLALRLRWTIRLFFLHSLVIFNPSKICTSMFADKDKNCSTNFKCWRGFFKLVLATLGICPFKSRLCSHWWGTQRLK